jgi:transposase
MEPKRPFSDLDWALTPPGVKRYIQYLEQAISGLGSKINTLENRTEKLETKVNKNSQNSSKPPSSDNPFKKQKKKLKKRKRKKGGQKGHQGHQQTMLEPTDTKPIIPDCCSCGNRHFDVKKMTPFYTHQRIELPEIKMDVTHYVLHQCQCDKCGKIVKAQLSKEYQPGYGPRLSALVAELSGIEGSSRQTVQNFCQSVLGFHISTGAVQNIIDRVSASLNSAYDRIGEVARTQYVNHIDETSWWEAGVLKWLWTMVNKKVAFYMIHNHRDKKAFLQLVDTWKGILVSDDYRLYTTWINRRQACLSHYIRRATGLSESSNESIRDFGVSILKELRRLCHWAKAPPSDKQWTDFYSRLIMLLFLYENADDDAGKLARLLLREMDSLWVFLEEEGVEHTNNRAERALRFGVLWRKRSYGTKSDKGNRWVERILSLKETCRLQSKQSFPLLVDFIDCYFKDQKPNLSWIDAI